MRADASAASPVVVCLGLEPPVGRVRVLKQC